ncbi:uncharacterized protein [Ptychodera flava]|uniref:uncharacterized protein n=1 Tax=Ptychodera flava TaxID=63121 RepID=UPI00396A18BC
MKWDANRDSLHFKQLDSPQIGSLTTKRNVVSYSASLYDPLGLLSPVHIRAKLLIQKLWQLDHQWDTPISAELRNTWSTIANDLKEVTSINIARRYFPHDNSESDVEIHAFADASDKAYGSAVYIKSGDHTTLVMAKTRVAPINKQSQTLPLLELMAAVIATRLSKFVTSALSTKYNILRNVLWSDSQIALHWINARGKPDVFTTNRVKEINSFTQTYKYVPTAHNPADLLTRGITPDELRNSSLWWEGPAWLKNNDSWPVCELFDSESEANITANHVSLATSPPVEPVHGSLPTVYAKQDTARVYCGRHYRQTPV